MKPIVRKLGELWVVLCADDPVSQFPFFFEWKDAVNYAIHFRSSDYEHVYARALASLHKLPVR